MPDDAIGVYGFWCVNPVRCVYVGKAERQSIRKRVKQQWKHSKNPILKSWIRSFAEHLEICYLALPRAKMHKVGDLETKLIGMWNPQANKQKRKKQ